MRKTVGDPVLSEKAAHSAGELDIERAAHVFVTSEHPDHPVENAFDRRRGPGGTQWVAAEGGPQTVMLAFDAPQPVRAVAFEVEEVDAARTQEIELAFSGDGGQSFETARRQEFNFSPLGATFERERWTLDKGGVTHLRLTIRPDKSGGGRHDPLRARLTSLAVEVS